jgi:uncharacterized protein involved in exopolysaccharide biosynthesis
MIENKILWIIIVVAVGGIAAGLGVISLYESTDRSATTRTDSSTV